MNGSPSLTDLLSVWLENPLKPDRFYYIENTAIKCGWCRDILAYIYEDHVWPGSPTTKELAPRLYAADPQFSVKLESSLTLHKC